MPLPGRIFASDEELGKKNDEYRPFANGTTPVSGITWAEWIPSLRMRKRRFGVLLLVIVGFYLFVKNIPTDLEPVSERIDIRVPGKTYDGHASGVQVDKGNHDYNVQTEGPGDAPPPDDDLFSEDRNLPGHYYNGPVKWYFLAATLQAASRKMRMQMHTKNVVFAASDIQSLTRLIPMACEMSRYNRNVIHMLIMGRHDLTVTELKEINGVDEESCAIWWHDARPDYALYSTEARMELSVSASLIHIENFLHPQLYIINDPRHDDPAFVKGFDLQTSRQGKTVVRLPRDSISKMLWITRLDGGSLNAWHNTYIDILIQAPSDSSGSLIRLLKSIERADYFGIRYPHLTIELPPYLDPPTEEFLDNFVWPPPDPAGGVHTSQLTLRRRISDLRLTPTEASIRLFESFYPARVRDSHVLLLSPNVELSPLYYHYLMFNTLEYKYSQYGAGTRELEALMGISLARPSYLLDGKTPMIAPDPLDKDDEGATPFLWQAPDVHATLYFGDKWRELHSFLSLRLSTTSTAIPKTISPNYPAFAEHMLELMRIRNYFILRPHIADYAIATVHNELYQYPEEFTPISKEDSEESAPPDTDELFLTAAAPTRPPPSQEDPLTFTPLHLLLPDKGDLPELSTLPLVAYDGQSTYPTASYKASKKFTDEFRMKFGGCPSGADPKVYQLQADDLFCSDKNPYDGSLGEELANNRDAPLPAGFGGARARGAKQDAKRDPNEVRLSDDRTIVLNATERRIKMMQDEARKHLVRQQNTGGEEKVLKKEDRKKVEADGKTKDEKEPVEEEKPKEEEKAKDEKKSL